MNREEILNRSRNENKQGDERELAAKAKAGEIAAAVGLTLCWVLNLISYAVVGRGSSMSILIVSGIELPLFLVQAIQLKTRRLWIITIIWAILFPCYLVIWIMELTGSIA